MLVLQVTNIFSHHQAPLANALAAQVGSKNFRMVLTDEPDLSRVRMGWCTQQTES